MELLENIRASLPWLPPDQIDDVIAEVAILVLEGRIEESNIRAGINRYLPALKKKYKSADFDISLDQPIGEDEGNATLGDCGEPAVHVRHCKGHLAGNLCLSHRRQQARVYMSRHREKNRTHPPLTQEERKERARIASIARWSKPEWVDQNRRSEFGKKVGASKKLNIPMQSLAITVK